MKDMTVKPDQAEAAVKDPSSKPRGRGAWRGKNIRIHQRRTSVRMEPTMCEALNEIAELEKCSIHDLCSAVYDLKAERTSFSAALRVFMIEYYRSALQENGHITSIREKIQTNKTDSGATGA